MLLVGAFVLLIMAPVAWMVAAALIELLVGAALVVMKFVVCALARPLRKIVLRVMRAARAVFGARSKAPTYDWAAAEARQRLWRESPEELAWREAFEQRHREALAAYNARVAEQLAQERLDLVVE